MLNQLTLNQTYTRTAICQHVGGGSLESYLPTRDGRVLCACLDPKRNPEAPEKILVGEGRGRLAAARKLIAQSLEPGIPVFLKESINNWKYIGNFQYVDCSIDPDVIAHESARSNRQDVAMVIYLRQITSRSAQRAGAPN
jgi:hypothetical protein